MNPYTCIFLKDKKNERIGKPCKDCQLHVSFPHGKQFLSRCAFGACTFLLLVIIAYREKIEWHSVLMWIPTDTGHVESSHYINLS